MADEDPELPCQCGATFTVSDRSEFGPVIVSCHECAGCGAVFRFTCELLRDVDESGKQLWDVRLEELVRPGG